MPVTYELISSNVLGSAAASVTFSSIPGTYTDLEFRMSIRSSRNATDSPVFFTFNGSSSALYSATKLEAYGSTAASGRTTNDTKFNLAEVPASGAGQTSNTFSSSSIYIPNYAGSSNKVASTFNIQENNDASAWVMNTSAMLRRDTAAITSVTFTDGNSANFVAGSSFYLYGIKNS